MRPEYRMARPGTLISPTKVAATSCHAVSPESSQVGDGNRSKKAGEINCYLQLRSALARHFPTRFACSAYGGSATLATALSNRGWPCLSVCVTQTNGMIESSRGYRLK